MGLCYLSFRGFSGFWHALNLLSGVRFLGSVVKLWVWHSQGLEIGGWFMIDFGFCSL